MILESEYIVNDFMVDFNGMSTRRGLFCVDVRESYSLYISVYIFLFFSEQLSLRIIYIYMVSSILIYYW